MLRKAYSEWPSVLQDTAPVACMTGIQYQLTALFLAFKPLPDLADQPHSVVD